jgi:hypothetical protein
VPLVEESFVPQPALEGFESPAKGALAGVLDVLDDELNVAAKLVQGQPRPHQDLSAVRKLRVDVLAAAPEQCAAYLALVVLEREIDVARARAREVRDLSFHPHLGKPALEQVLDAVVQGRHGEYLAARPFGGSGGWKFAHERRCKLAVWLSLRDPV